MNINSLGNSLYNFLVKNPLEAWTDNETEKMSSGEIAKETAKLYALSPAIGAGTLVSFLLSPLACEPTEPLNDECSVSIEGKFVFTPKKENIFQGDTVRIAFPKNGIEDCGESNKIWITVGNSGKLPVKSEGNNYYIDYTFTQTDRNDVILHVKKGSTEQVYLESVYVKPLSDNLKVNVSYGEDGPIAMRPVELNAEWLTKIPDADISYHWSIFKAGVSQVAAEADGQEASFIPQNPGSGDPFDTYQAELRVSIDGLEDIIINSSTFDIYPFPAPTVEISGNQYPNSGETVNYSAALIPPSSRELGPEDEAAECFWTVSHVNPVNGQTIEEQIDTPCSAQLSYSYPAVSTQTNYLISLTVVGDNDAYEVNAEPLSVTLYPGANQVQADFSVTYDADHGAIPHYPVQLTASVANPPEGIDLVYEWEISDSTGQALGSQPLGMPAVSYTFEVSDTYNVKLTIKDGNETLDEIERSVTIYPFPQPDVTININDNNPIYTNEPAFFTALIDRDWTEDQSATYAWQISHIEGSVEVIDLPLTFPSPMDQMINFTFDSSRTYTIAVTVAGMHGAEEAYSKTQIEFANVYQNTISLPPPASIIGPLAAQVNTPIDFLAGNADETLYSYEWFFGDGTTDVGALPLPKIYAQTGTYNVQLKVARLDDPDVYTIASQFITITPTSVTPPAFQINIPYAAEEDTSVPMTVTLSDGDPNDWEVSWLYGDGGSGSGYYVSHAYADPSKYNIVVSLTNIADPANQIISSFQITVVPHGDPVPGLVITPGMGPAPLTITADGESSYATASGADIVDYRFNWGDGSAEENGTSPARSHTYTCFDSACTYTVRMTVTDSNGKTGTITSSASTWQAGG